MAFIYKIENLVNGKLYIGKETRLGERWKGHCYQARRGSMLALHRAIRKYGELNFKVTVLREVSDARAALWEKAYISLYNTFHGEGYNCTAGGDGTSGYIPTPEVKAKSIARCAGYRHSRETRLKISESNRGKSMSSTLKQKLSIRCRGNDYRSRSIVQMSLNDEPIEVFRSAKLAASTLGLHHSSICAAANGRYTHSGGFHWKWVVS